MTLKYPNQLSKTPINILRGVVPTFTGFDTTNPTNLANATDGDPITATGEGKKTVGAAAEIGKFVFDLGSEKNVIVGMKISVHSSASNIFVYINSDTDTDKGSSQLSVATVAAKIVTASTRILLNTRYIYIIGVSGAACDGFLGLYEVVAYEMGV